MSLFDLLLMTCLFPLTGSFCCPRRLVIVYFMRKWHSLSSLNQNIFKFVYLKIEMVALLRTHSLWAVTVDISVIIWNGTFVE